MTERLDEAEAGDGTWQELIELAARARARAHHHFLNTTTHDLFIECAERLEALAPMTATRGDNVGKAHDPA